MFADGTSTLKALREKLVQHSFLYSVNNNVDGSSSIDVEDSGSLKRRVNTSGIAESLQLPEDHARVILDTLASVLPDYGRGTDPLVCCPCADVDSVGADIDDLILFLYIQTYKKLAPRPHKDAASVADVWPSNSAFDGFLATLSPLQVLNCHDSVIYILAPLNYATVNGCSDAVVVLGAVGKVAPYNTFYPDLEMHLAQVGLDPTINKWDKPLALGMVDPHDSLSHPAGVSDGQAESATVLHPDRFLNFVPLVTFANYIVYKIVNAIQGVSTELEHLPFLLQDTS